MLDTSFIIRLVNENDPLHQNALGYWEYYLREKYTLLISAIAVAEFCVKGSFNMLPMAYMQHLPFNHMHGQKAGQFAEIVFRNKSERGATFSSRAIIPNDTKMFAQAEFEQCDYFVSADTEANKIYDLIGSEYRLKFKFVDIHKAYNDVYLELPFYNEDTP